MKEAKNRKQQENGKRGCGNGAHDRKYKPFFHQLEIL